MHWPKRSMGHVAIPRDANRCCCGEIEMVNGLRKEKDVFDLNPWRDRNPLALFLSSRNGGEEQ